MKVAYPGLFYTMRVLQNKQTSTSKDAMKTGQLVEQFCFFKMDKHTQIKKAEQFFKCSL